MDMLRRLYMVVADNIRKAREKRPKKTKEQKPHNFTINDMVLVKDPDSAVFKPRYQPNYRVTAIFGDNRIEVQHEKGHKSVRSSHVKYVEQSEKVVQQLPNKEILQNYGRSSKLLIAAKDIPDLQFNLEKAHDISEDEEHSKKLLEGAGEVMEVMESDVLSQTVARKSKDSSQDSKVREHSINSLRSEAGVAVWPLIPEKTTEISTDVGLQKKTSKDSNDSQNLRELWVNHNMIESKNNLNGDKCEQALIRTSEFSKYLTDSWGERTVGDPDVQKCQLQQSEQGISTTQIACEGESSNSLQKLSNCIGNNVSVSNFSWFKSMSQIVGLTAAWHQDKVELPEAPWEQTL